MKLAVVSSDEVVSNVLVTVSARRGHQCMTAVSADRLARALPFVPNFVLVCLREFIAADDPEIVLVRRHCPDAGIVVIAEAIAPGARSVALRDGAIDIVQVPYNPFDLLTLLERWEANQTKEKASKDTCQVADIVVDLESYIATKHRSPLHLTRLELRILYVLCEHYPNVAPTDRLLAFAWGHDSDADSAILRTHISHIRARLREAGGSKIEIVARHSIGYTLTLIDS